MGDEPVLADLDPAGETAFDHVPAERTLKEAEQQNAGERHPEAARQLPSPAASFERTRAKRLAMP